VTGTPYEQIVAALDNEGLTAPVLRGHGMPLW
jgi:hypothetical protein